MRWGSRYPRRPGRAPHLTGGTPKEQKEREVEVSLGSGGSPHGTGRQRGGTHRGGGRGEGHTGVAEGSSDLLSSSYWVRDTSLRLCTA